jgi:hypothetical protein
MMAFNRLANHLPAIENETTQPDSLTPVPRAFVDGSSGFPGENFFEPNAGAAGRTSTVIPFE